MKYPQHAALTERAIAASGLQVDEFAKAIEAGRRTVHHWLAGNIPPSGPARVLLNAIIVGRIPHKLRGPAS